MDARRRRISLGVVLVFVAAWIAVFVFASPDRLIEGLGIENAYLVLFALGVVGAVGSMTTFSTYPALVAFATGGMNLMALALVAGLGLTLGDALFYSLGGEVKALLGGRPREKAEQLGEWLEDRPSWVLPLVTWVWVGFLPLANNILTGALAVGGYRLRRIALPLFLGNVTVPLVVAWLARQGVRLFG